MDTICGAIRISLSVRIEAVFLANGSTLLTCLHVTYTLFLLFEWGASVLNWLFTNISGFWGGEYLSTVWATMVYHGLQNCTINAYGVLYTHRSACRRAWSWHVYIFITGLSNRALRTGTLQIQSWCAVNEPTNLLLRTTFKFASC